MRHSLLLRLLALSLAVAAVAIAATALLATYGAEHQRRDETDSLDADSAIRTALLAYATEHGDWAGAEGLVDELSERYGRRIALTTVDGVPIVDSASHQGLDDAGLPAIPSARVDAAEPGRLPTKPGTSQSGSLTIVVHAWQLTEEERRQRQALAEQATACFAEAGVEVSIALSTEVPKAGERQLAGGADETLTDISADPCVPSGLTEPGATARDRDRREAELLAACLDHDHLAYAASTDRRGMPAIEPIGDTATTSAWTTCQYSASVAATRPYVAPPAELYLGVETRFDVFTDGGLRRVVGLTVAILALASVITLFVGRRLTRPILAVTSAAERMGGGNHAIRVPARGDDEVTRLAKAFNAMAESIETSARQRKDLVGDIAHELRNPLTNVRGRLDAVEDGVIPLDVDLIGSLREEYTLLERLVADLHDLALADAGELRIHPEDTDAADLAAQVVAAHRSVARAEGVTIGLDADEPVYVRADPVRMRQAIGNLVANAITYTPSGGRIDVAVRRAGVEAVVTVADTGSGIGPKHLPYVFERFYRADPARSRATGGSGLGLAITKQLIEVHDGRITVDSPPSGGTVFTIAIPG